VIVLEIYLQLMFFLSDTILYFCPMHRILLLFFTLLISCTMYSKQQKNDLSVSENFDWQGHRGCRGLMPENSIEAFLHALSFPIQTLELDLVLTKDGVVLVSHEPWFSDEICDCEKLENNNIFNMTYAEVKTIDCGIKLNPRFPEQQKIPTHKPSLIDVVTAVKEYCSKENRPMPKFNIELKSDTAWDVKYIPSTTVFVERVNQTIGYLGIVELSTIQSFDPRILNEFMLINSQLRYAFLSDEAGDPLKQMSVLNRLPHIYSPNYLLIDAKMIKQLQKMKLEIITWTVNDLEAMRKLIDMGVNGIITDYPNLINQLN
jgi:glycerophosphoryl diester phosphodiesterase